MNAQASIKALQRLKPLNQRDIDAEATSTATKEDMTVKAVSKDQIVEGGLAAK